jgi:hypothetical protein
LNASLSGLTIGSLNLTPAFDEDVTEYEATTSNATNTVTATAKDPAATIVIKNGNTVVENGSAASWATGANTLTIEVTNGDAKKTYTVTVTKS